MMNLESENEKPVARPFLLVEDMELIANGLTSWIEKNGQWKVDVSRTAEDALVKLEEAFRLRRMPTVISIDLGLPPKVDSPEIGLFLLDKLNKNWKGLSLVVHSSLEPREEVVRSVIAQGASYIFIRDITETKVYVEMLPHIARGFKIYSPKPAALMPNVVAMKPDPFGGREEIWKTLRNEN